MAEINVRSACEEDIPAAQAIFAHEVRHGLATFEEVPPPVDVMVERWRKVTEAGMPYVVAEREGEILGYALAGVYRPRPAYRFTLESSVYVKPKGRGQGIARALMARVLTDGEAGEWEQMVAVIGDSGNVASIGLHRALGFEHVGTLQRVGFKFDRWVDTVIMQRSLT